VGHIFVRIQAPFSLWHFVTFCSHDFAIRQRRPACAASGSLGVDVRDELPFSVGAMIPASGPTYRIAQSIEKVELFSQNPLS